MFDFTHTAQLNRIEALLRLVLRREGVIIQQGALEMSLLDDVQAAEDKALAAITANTNALGAVADAIRNKDAQIADLSKQLADALAAGADPAALQAIVDKANAIVAASDAQATAEAALTNTTPAPVQNG